MTGAPRRGVWVSRHGGPEVLEIRELPPLILGPGEVEVRVSHVALNHLDLWVRRGVPGHDFHLPHVPGSDVSGWVEGRPVVLHPSWGCGQCSRCIAGTEDRCQKFQIRGENVDGGCVTTLAAPAWRCLPVPERLTLAEAASMPLTLLTAWHMLVTRAVLARGERVLVQAGGSGVGVMAIQIARLYGCEVHATASTPARRARIEALGAVAHDYEDPTLRGRFDVVVESVGEATWRHSIGALAWGGRLVCCGATTGGKVSVNLQALFFKQLSLLGSTMGSGHELERAWAEVAAGRIVPVVDRVMPMSQIAEAHGVLERRKAFGKVVLAADLAGARGGDSPGP